MLDKEAAERGLPVEIHAVISKDRGAGLGGDSFLPWQMSRDTDAVPPDHMFIFIDKFAWGIDFFTSYGGIVASDKFLALLHRHCADNIHASRLTLINRADRELPDKLYFIKFTSLTDAVDFDRMDFNGAYHDIIGGTNEISEDDQGRTLIKRAANIAFIKEKPEVFLECNLPQMAMPLFCSEGFKAECERAGIVGPWFWPENELLVVDFFQGWGGAFEDAIPQLITLAQRKKWKTKVDRSSFFRPENVKLSPAHLEVMRKAAERIKNKR